MKYVLIVLFSFFLFNASAQQSERLKQLEAQRKEALKDIEETSRRLKETQATAKNSLNRLNLLARQVMSRRNVIDLLNKEINSLDDQIFALRKEVDELQVDLNKSRTNYANSAQKLYRRHTSQDKLLFILSAESFIQSFRRMRYLREYAEWQKKQAREIIEKQTQISRKQTELEKSRSDKQLLLATREQERMRLQGEESDQKAEVQQLNKQQKELQAVLKKKQQQANALNQEIERLIAEEIRRAEEEAETARKKAQADGIEEKPEEKRQAETKGGYAMTQAERKLSADFGSNRGRLPYPVSGRHTIVSQFGEQQHQQLKYVRTNNNGIDIETTPGSDARAVFTGVITRIFVVPGYNNSVIIRHGNYLTVYSNLSQVYVKVGDKVKTGQSIGKIFVDSEEGNSTILHFQLWKEKTKLNPAPWLN
ncbi:murein hydrolase activator EnvC [Parabacteroides sp. Marseille-P3160]|uniref:murein hydrolase activator EnvC family protein n=1 Tax=Parabacteroides sp. Marseille-P3160 TaxID=1917887 RepID=UPI0009BAF0A8|nr:peptidoglycan DD-metalloendopeptidase family protein [Parabacteroides sp. Marseille-P3160]